jgi:RsiW-degrading membrane proteinase PrsW (M82 family)
MLERMLGTFKSFYDFPGLSPLLVLLSILIAAVFAAIWLGFYRPGLLRQPRTWLIALAAAILTWTAIAFVQVPLQTWSQQWLIDLFGTAAFLKWLLLTGLPLVLFSGLVQETTKFIPVMAYWFARHKQLDARSGLLAGAIAGAGFGIFEAVWVHNTIFATGWTWQSVQVGGYLALIGFWERLFAVGFHIAAAALSGYGLATGRGWQFLLISAGAHTLLNYPVLLINRGIITAVQSEIIIAVLAVILTVIVLRINYRLIKSQRQSTIESASE